MTRFQQMFYDIKTTGDYDVVGEDIDYKIIIDDEAKEIILQWQGSDSREDWKHNFMFLPWFLDLNGKKVITTHGYACAYKSTQNKPMIEFLVALAKHEGYKAIIRGHSFGSAMTKIATRHYYYITKKPLDAEYTFGDVKCWLNPFLCSRKYAAERFEFVTINDFVTWQVPFFFRTAKAKVGDKFSIKKIFNTEYYHMSYDLYDYSKFE